MLSIREHSQKQMSQKLTNKGFEPSVIASCIDYLVENDWLSDERFCNSFIRSKADKGQGLKKIRSELVLQGIEHQTIYQQLQEENIDWQNVCIKALKKKLGIFSCDDIPKHITFRQKIKLENFLRFRGFSAEEIKVAIRQNTKLENQG